MPKDSFIKNFASGMPTWAKGVTGVVILGGVVFGGYKLYKWYEHKKEMEGAEAETKATKDTLDKLKKKYKATLDTLQLSQIANQIEKALQGYGTDTSSIYRAFTYVKNDLDMVNLTKVYGIRKISSGKGNLAPDFEGTLASALTEEMSSKEIQALNKNLASKGISYRF